MLARNELRHTSRFDIVHKIRRPNIFHYFDLLQTKAFNTDIPDDTCILDLACDVIVN